LSKRAWAIIFTAGMAIGAIGVMFVPGVPAALLTFFKSNEAPAWIQAVGSILAIVAAALIARNQTQGATELEERKQAVSEKHKFGVIMALMARAHGLANDITKAFETHKHEDFDQISPALMVDTHRALKALPVFEIPHGLLALDVLTISRGLASLEEGWKELLEISSPESEEVASRMQALSTLASEISNISREAIDECKKEIAIRSKLVVSNG